MEIIFRKAEFADVKALVLLEDDCFTYNKMLAKHFVRLIRKGNADLIIAEFSKKGTIQTGLVGYGLLFYRNNSKKARLYSLAVSPRDAGKGIGKKLLLKLEEMALLARKSVITLEVKESNEQALNLYKKNAYNIIEKIDNYYEDGASALRLSKTL